MTGKKRGRKQSIPSSNPAAAGLAHPDLLVLDKFSERSLEIWQERSKDLDELHQLVYFALEPERLKHRNELLAALNSVPAPPLALDRWVRIVNHQYTNAPLSAAGSLKAWGGRFSIGIDVDLRVADVFPALYLGSSYETAFREKYQCVKGSKVSGLTPEELALNVSTTCVFVNGHIERVFDARQLSALEPICKVLAKFKLPSGVPPILRRLNQSPTAIAMIRNALQMKKAIQHQNWRSWPIQFGIPSPSQQFGDLARAAGYEAILFESSKGEGCCLAVFPDNLSSVRSFVELADAHPPEVLLPRLDVDSADELAGWHVLRPKDMPAKS